MRENSEDAAPVAETFFRTEKINALRDACSLLDVSQESHQDAEKFFATFSFIFATLPPPKSPSTCGSSSFSLLKQENRWAIFTLYCPI